MLCTLDLCLSKLCHIYGKISIYYLITFKINEVKVTERAKLGIIWFRGFNTHKSITA